MGMLLYGLPAKAGTRHNVGPMITQCLSQRLSPASPSPSGHYLTLMEELLPVCHPCSCCQVSQRCFKLLCCAPRCLVLCCIASCCADEPSVLRCAALCCAVLCCAVLCCVLLTQCWTISLDAKHTSYAHSVGQQQLPIASLTYSNLSGCYHLV